MFPDHKIIWGGDFNVNLASNYAASVLINQFISKYNLEAVKSDISSNVNIVNYTYRHKTLEFQSYIDYFIINANLNSSVRDFDIIDCGANLSDHNPIILEISCDILKLRNDPSNKTAFATSSVQYTLRWDHANTSEFYHRTFIDSAFVFNMFNDAYDNLMNCDIDYFNDNYTDSWFCNDLNKHINIIHLIEDVYGNIVNILYKAANDVIPSRKQNFYKYWWNE